ncbi:hypothetical protein HY383_00750 [Candidatus Daviesbacteria bacterium]|nr:hypothetical protein [Candidatus Daviesbacteria bacterium]
MEDPKWLRLLTVGLVLAAIAVGYFLFTGRFASDSTKKAPQVGQAVSSPSPRVIPSATPTTSPAPAATSAPIVSPSPSATPASAYSIIANRTKGGMQVLPNTGFPIGLAAALSVSVMISGWGLRRFPK